MLENPTYYDVLKVTRDAPTLVVQVAYKALMQLTNPDHFKGREEEAVKIAKALREARDALIDPEIRSQYDRWLESQKDNQMEQFSESINMPASQYQTMVEGRYYEQCRNSF